jgi:hypothetical protein
LKNEVLLALANKLINDAILEHEQNHPSLRGPRGLPGKNAKDFCFEDHQDQINELIIKNIPQVKDGKDFNFEDHANRITEIIKANIPEVKDGKDFVFDDHSAKIFGYIDSIKDSIKLKFSDLTDEEKESLKGEKGNSGRPGRDGHDFIFEENSEEIYARIEQEFSKIKDSLKLRFSDLSREEKEELKLKFQDLNPEDISLIKGPRGQRGKPGRDFFFEENQERIANIVYDYIESIKGQLKGQDGKSIRGMPGIAGLIGKDGRPGMDGVDAPVIKDIRIEQQRDKRFRFIFIFDNGNVIETNDIELPVLNNAISQYVLLQNTESVSSEIVISNIVCDPTVYVGAAVRMLSDGSCVNALADTYGNANVIGICQSKSSTTLCNVRVMGVLPELYAGLDVTKEYYLSDTVPGGIADTFPDTTGHIKLKLGQPFTTTRLFVFKGERVVRG